MQIRPAAISDVPLILELIRELALYERAPDAVVATEADLLRDGFGPTPRFECLIAEIDGTAAGFALYFFNYSTWLGRAGIHLEDLFVRPRFRGFGIGKALLARVAAITTVRDLGRLQWEVLDWNQPAIDFYEGLGAEFLTEWRIMRVTDAALAELAGGASTGANEPPPASALVLKALKQQRRGDGPQGERPQQQRATTEGHQGQGHQ